MKTLRKLIVIAFLISCIYAVLLPPTVGYLNETYLKNNPFYGFESQAGDILLVFGPTIVLSIPFIFVVFDVMNERAQAAQFRAIEEEKIRAEESKRRQADREAILELERKIKVEKDLEQAKKFEIAGRYEEAAKICDSIGLLEKAGDLRRMGRTTYLISTNFTMGKDGAISCNCPTCGSSQSIESKTNMVTCKHCGNNYIIPKKVLDML